MCVLHSLPHFDFIATNLCTLTHKHSDIHTFGNAEFEPQLVVKEEIDNQKKNGQYHNTVDMYQFWKKLEKIKI